jgi:hypothetical protein
MRDVRTVVALAALLAGADAFAQQGQPKRDETGILPEGWSIDEEVKQLEGSVKDFNGLIKSLGSANTELQELLTKHLKTPGDKVTSSLLEKKLASYAADAAKEFDRIIAGQDAMLSNLRALNRKLNKFNSYLQAKIESTKTNAEDQKKQVEKMERELEEAAAAVKNAGSEEEARKAKEAFSRLYTRYRLQKRYAEGYAKNHEGYKRLSAHLSQLNDMFVTLKDKFGGMVENLETEKKFLVENMGLQEDSLRVRSIIRDGVINGQEAIGKVTEKMALLFLKVDAFNKINDRVSTNLDSFVEFQQSMLGISEKLNNVGVLGDSKSLDAVIEQFYSGTYKDEPKKAEAKAEPKDVKKEDKSDADSQKR